MTNVTIDSREMRNLLGDLLGRDVSLTTVSGLDPDPATYRGLITDSDELVAVIGSDLAFAHGSGAALALIPAGRIAEAGDTPNPELLEIFGEVANVVSRLVNEATPERVRLDPGVEHLTEDLQEIISDGRLVQGCEVTISGYGVGRLGIWHRA